MNCISIYQDAKRVKFSDMALSKSLSMNRRYERKNHLTNSDKCCLKHHRTTMPGVSSTELPECQVKYWHVSLTLISLISDAKSCSKAIYYHYYENIVLFTCNKDNIMYRGKVKAVEFINNKYSIICTCRLADCNLYTCTLRVLYTYYHCGKLWRRTTLCIRLRWIKLFVFLNHFAMNYKFAQVI